MNRKLAFALLASVGKSADEFSLESESALVSSLDDDMIDLENAISSAARDGELSDEQKAFYEQKILLLRELIAKKKGLE